ncbi:hypothetical protein T484DRAFT_1922462 [Baffinella frigidus]|nr:hypothetical protein T484DRAFT_1922462 [Cryptophyta sp. CCMP2293]
MARQHTLTLTTPEDFINAFCGTQTSHTYPAARPRTYTLLAEDLLLCAFGATPRPDDTSAYCNAHAGAARWLQRATMPQRRGRPGSETSEEEAAPERQSTGAGCKMAHSFGTHDDDFVRTRSVGKAAGNSAGVPPSFLRAESSAAPNKGDKRIAAETG